MLGACFPEVMAAAQKVRAHRNRPGSLKDGELAKFLCISTATFLHRLLAAKVWARRYQYELVHVLYEYVVLSYKYVCH